jgi:serine/threonine-protein kinase
MRILRRFQSLLGSAPKEPDAAEPSSPAADVEATSAVLQRPDASISELPTLAGAAPAAGHAPSANARVPSRRIGRYEIAAELGRGAMGVVYKAHDLQLGRTVAIKSILPGLLEGAELPQYKERFDREGKTHQSLSHPGIVQVLDLIVDETRPAMVLEYVDGEGLDDLAKRRPLSVDESLDVVLRAAEALDYAHARGIVHRDIKPANILVTREGVVKITDFGVARLEGSTLTRTGQLVGTPAFMSPEQFTGDSVDGRSDLFSLGAVLYWLCTGRKPFEGTTLATLGAQLVMKDPPSVRELNPALPAGVETIIARLLAKKPADRYPRGNDAARDMMLVRSGRQPAG